MMIISRRCFQGALRPVRRVLAWLVCAAVVGLTSVAFGQSSITNDCFVVSCPPDRTIFICNGTYEFVEAGLSVSNRCPTALLPAHSIECDPALGTTLEMGVRPVACRVLAGGETVAECRFVITVRSTLAAPVIQCPTNRVVVVPCDTNCVPVSYALPEVTGGSVLSCNPPSGSCFPVGLSFVTCIATNDCGDRDGCSFAVRVLTEPPLILCRTNELQVPVSTLACATSFCVSVSYPLPEVIGGTLIECTPPPGTCFSAPSIGAGSTVHRVTCSATNNCGSLAQCGFSIRAYGDPQPPRLDGQCSTFYVTNRCNEACTPAWYPVPSMIAAGGVVFASVSCNPPSGTCLPTGTTRVGCIARNACGEDRCSFDVRVIAGPTRRPDLFFPPGIVITNCSTNCVIVNYPPPVLPPGTSIRCTPSSGSCFPVGRTMVGCVVSNECGVNGGSFNVYNLPFGPCIEPPRNMVLWLPFDETTGPIAQNLILGAPNGTRVNGPRTDSGQDKFFNYPGGQSLHFDGSNDFVRVPHYSAIGLGQSDLTISAWVYAYGGSTNGRRAIVSKMETNSAGRRGYELYLSAGILKLDLFGDDARTFDSVVVVPYFGSYSGGLDPNWRHVAVTVSRSGNGEVRFYLDGANVATLPGPIPASIGNSSPLFVGASTVGGGGTVIAPFVGEIDEVNIFNRALDTGEIASLARRALVMCKIKSSVPRYVPFPPASECVNVPVRVCNNLAIPRTITWTAAGPMPIPTSGGNFVLPPFSCTNVPITLCRPTNGLPVGAAAQWTFTVSSDYTCPVTSTGSVVNPGPQVSASVPNTIARIPGTNSNHSFGVLLNGLPPVQPVRLRLIGPDMEPDLDIVGLDGLPPGEPALRHMPDDNRYEFGLDVRFTSVEPVGLYTILIETDLDGDGDFDPFASFAAENPVAGTPTLSIVEGINGYHLLWNNEGDGFGLLQLSDKPEGPWETIHGAGTGYLVTPSERRQYFRVKVE